jgi:hypothetical protein
MSLKICLDCRATSARLLLAKSLWLRNCTLLGSGRRSLRLGLGGNRLLRSECARRTKASGNERVGTLRRPTTGDRLSPCGIPTIKGGDDAIFNDPERCADALEQPTIVTDDKECALAIKKESLE